MLEPRNILKRAEQYGEIAIIEALILLEEHRRVLPELTRIASTINHRINGDIVTYVAGRQINYTNICRVRCSFCSFFRRKDDPEAFSLSINELIRQIQFHQRGLKEIVLEGGVNPELNLRYHIKMIQSIKEEFPELHLRAYTPSEIYSIARLSRLSIFDVLRRLKECGLDSMNGSPTYILYDRMRKKFTRGLIRTRDWIDCVRSACRLGIPLTVTLPFGFVENEIHISEHLDIIKNLQKEIKPFTTFIPSPMILNNDRVRDPLRHSKEGKLPSIDWIVAVHAVSRLLFSQHIRDIRADWFRLGIPNTIRALRAGANEIGLLSHDPHTIRSPENNHRGTLPVQSIRQSIAKIGKTLRESSRRYPSAHASEPKVVPTQRIAVSISL